MATLPRFETSSKGEAAHPGDADLATLRQHQALCSAANGRWVGVKMDATRLGGFMWAHVVTTLAIVTALVGTLLLWI